MRSSTEVLRFKAEILDELENISRIADIVEKRRKELRKHTEETDVYMDSITLRKDISGFLNVMEKILA